MSHLLLSRFLLLENLWLSSVNAVRERSCFTVYDPEVLRARPLPELPWRRASPSELRPRLRPGPRTVGTLRANHSRFPEALSHTRTCQPEPAAHPRFPWNYLLYICTRGSKSLNYFCKSFLDHQRLHKNCLQFYMSSV